MTLRTAVLPLTLTVAYLGTLVALRRFRLPQAVFVSSVDLLDPRNYRPAGRWLILVAVLLSIGALVTWLRALGG
ncbi:MAG TPA: hypothetical protein VMG41_15440 [Gemmatimonadales bacterium]|nr:hypothetical protein [Gemmatimonadales bacterium]